MKGDPVPDYIRKFFLSVAWALSNGEEGFVNAPFILILRTMTKACETHGPVSHSYNPTLGTNFIIAVTKYQTKITFKEEFTCVHSLRRYSLSWFKRHNACGLHFARSRKRWMLVLNMSSIFSFIWIINWMFWIPVHGMVPSHSGVVVQFLLIVSKNIITDIPKGVPHPIPPVLLNSSCN